MAGFRAANEFRHDSERRAAKALAEGLPNPAQLVGNYVLPGRFAGGEIDLVAVMPEGILTIEVKHWYGRIYRIGALVEFEDGYTVPNPFPGLQYKAKMLRSHLVNRGLIDRRLPVGGCLVFVGSLQLPDEVCAEEHVFSLDVATKKRALLQSLSIHGLSGHLDARTIEAIADALAERTDGRDTWRVGHFLLDDELKPTEYTRQFVGRCTHVHDRDVLLRCWEVDPLADDRKRKDILRQLEAEASALARLEASRCRSLPIVYDAFRDPASFDVFWVVQEYLGSGTLATNAHRFVKETDFRDQVLTQLDEAMMALRGAGIVHRNLGAEVISVGSDNRVLIGGLEFSAAVDGQTQRRTVVRRSRRPPEVVSGARDSHAGDIYAAGLMVLDILTPGEADPIKRARKIGNRDAAKAIAACVATEATERPTSLETLRAALKGWRP